MSRDEISLLGRVEHPEGRGAPAGRITATVRFLDLWRQVAVVLVLGAVPAIAACGTTGASAISAKAPSYEVLTGNVGGLGTVLVDGRGFTLYAFVPDDHSGRSTCDGPCAAAWPPLTLPSATSAPIAGPGVDRAHLGTTLRPDGLWQVTYYGWPLYRWTDDASPGTATGQGIYNLGGYWYTVNPNGSLNIDPNPNGF